MEMHWQGIDEMEPQRATQPGGFVRLLQRAASLLGENAGTRGKLLRQVETLPLGGKRSLILVECDGQRFLVTAGGDHVSAPVPLTQEFAMRRERSEGDYR